MKSLAKNSILNAVYNVLNILFPLVTSSYVTRILLPAGVGKVAYAQSIVYYFVLLAMLGIPNYGLREIARIRDNQKKKNKIDFRNRNQELIEYHSFLLLTNRELEKLNNNNDDIYHLGLRKEKILLLLNVRLHYYV